MTDRRSDRVQLAVADHDLNRALIDGVATADGFDLDVSSAYDDRDRHVRMLRDGAFHASEFSFASFLIARSQGAPLVGIPVFPNRKFRQSYVFVNRRAGIREPGDLEGKRVGLRGWGTTASVWVRGMLHHTYGVDIGKVLWFSTTDVVNVRLPPWANLQRLDAGDDLDRMLREGLLDAVILPDVLPSVQRGDPAVGRLFEDYPTVEREYFRTTRIFPISHLVVVQEEAILQFHGLGTGLLGAFRRSRDECFRRIEDQRILAISWAGAALAEQRALMGRQYWPYNVADNRAVIETLVSYAREDGLIPTSPAVDELFLPETLSAPGA